MGIADLFRPKYRHSDVKVRLEAVRALTSDDSDILATIARNDREPAVRRLAIEKLDEAELLADIAKGDDDRAVRDFAGARAAEIWVTVACGEDDAVAAAVALEGLVRLADQRALAEVATRADLPEIRAGALERIEEPRALAEVAKSAALASVRAAALGKIADVDVLGAIAVDTNNKELGLGAIDGIEEEDLLEKIAQKAKNKAVRQRARRKLEELSDRRREESPRVSDATKRRHAEQSQLIREVEAVQESHDWDKAGAVIAKAEEEWRRLGGADDAAVEERFQRAVSRYQTRHKVAMEQLEAQRRVAVEAHRHDAPKLERRPEPQPLPQAQPIVEPPPEDDLRAQERIAREEERARRDAEMKAAREARNAEDAARRKEYEERGKQIAASLEALVGEMQTMLESKDGRAIDRLLGTAAKAFEGVTKVAGDARRNLEAQYADARAKLVIRTQELREAEDWQRWANVPRAEALIKEAQALLESEGPDLARLKDLQARWKTVGAIPRKKSQELWEQFKKVTDEVFEKVKGARAVQAEKTAAVVAVKEQLIAQAEALAESTDFEGTAEAFKELQRQWKESGGVPRKQGDALWKRFRAACDRFFERRKPHLDAQLAEQEDNLRAKEALCARIEQIVEAAPGEAGWGAAINEVKDAQRRWKDIGFVPRKDADAIYKRFRTACDALFEKRDAARDAEADARRAELDALRTELTEIEGIDSDGAVARAVGVRAKVRELAAQDLRPDAELAARIDQVLRGVVERFPAAAAGTELDPEAIRARREKLIAKAEELLPKDRPTITADLPPEQLVAQLKNALAKNALGNFGAQRDPYEAVDELRASWGEVGPVLDAAQQARFDEVVAKVLAHAEASGQVREERPQRDRGERDRGERRERRGRDRGGERGDRDRAGRGERGAAAPANVPQATTPQPAEVAAAAPAAVAVAAAAPEAAAVAEAAPAPANVPQDPTPQPATVPEPAPAVEVAPAPANVPQDPTPQPAAVEPAPAVEVAPAPANVPQDPTPQPAPDDKPAADAAPNGNGHDPVDDGWD